MTRAKQLVTRAKYLESRSSHKLKMKNLIYQFAYLYTTIPAQQVDVSYLKDVYLFWPFITSTQFSKNIIKQPCQSFALEINTCCIKQLTNFSQSSSRAIVLRKDHQLITAAKLCPTSSRLPKKKVPKTTTNTAETNHGTTPTLTTGPSAHGMKPPATPSQADVSWRNHPLPPSSPNIVKSTSVRYGHSSRAVSIKSKLPAN